MKCRLEKNGDAGLRFDDLNYGDDFIFTESKGITLIDEPAMKVSSSKHDDAYIYYSQHGGSIFDGSVERVIEGGKFGNLKVARIRAVSEVVFVIDTEGKGD